MDCHTTQLLILFLVPTVYSYIAAFSCLISNDKLLKLTDLVMMIISKYFLLFTQPICTGGRGTNNFIIIYIMKLTLLLYILMNIPETIMSNSINVLIKGAKFLENLWYCVSEEYYKIIWFYQLG